MENVIDVCNGNGKCNRNGWKNRGSKYKGGQWLVITYVSDVTKRVSKKGDNYEWLLSKNDKVFARQMCV